MDVSLSSVEFILREVAPVYFLDEIISKREWHIRIDHTCDTLTVDGKESLELRYNTLLRTLIWTDLAATGFDIQSGALQFNRDFTSCHGQVTTGSKIEFLVESVALSGMKSLRSAELAAPPAYYFDSMSDVSSTQANATGMAGIDQPSETSRVIPVESGQGQLKQMALDIIERAGQNVRTAPSQIPHTTSISKRTVGDPPSAAAGANPADPRTIIDDPSALESLTTSQVALIRYTTQKRPKGSTDENEWDSAPQLGVGTEQKAGIRLFVYLDNTDVTNFVTISGDGDHYTKEGGVDTHPDKSGFDINFRDMGRQRTFTGTLVRNGKEFEWKGGSPTFGLIDRLGDNKPVVGSDNLSLNALLFAVTSLSRESGGTGKSIDLAQQEADKILGRLMMASVDKDISDMLFKDVFVLTEAEKAIQQKGPEFLKRAGVHHVLKTIKTAERVKQSIKDKINLDKCDRFVPMCVSPIAPAKVVDDPVFLYGLDRTRDKVLVTQLQKEAQQVIEACSTAGYKIAVLSIQPYLKNAGEWYNILDTTLQDGTFLTDWKNKAAGSEGLSKTMYNLKKILDVLWQVTHESEDFKKKLKDGIKTPEELNAVLNGAAYDKAQEVLAWDDTLRAKIMEIFSKLDQVEKDKREQELADVLKKQMIVDGAKQGAFQSLGENLLSFMEKLRGNTTWTAREAQDALALAHAAEAEGTGGPVAAELKTAAEKEGKMQLKERWFSGVRAVVTVASIALLTWVLSNKAASMEWYEILAVTGEMYQGLATLHAEMTALRKSLKDIIAKSENTKKVQAFFASTGRWVYKYMLAPVGRFAIAIGKWLYNAVARIGGAFINGIRKFAGIIAEGLKQGLIAVFEKTVGRMVTFLKSVGIAWSNVFKACCNVLSFGLSVLCVYIAFRDCITAWRSGRPVDVVTSTFSALLTGLEVINLAVQGVAWLVGSEVWVAGCTTFGMVLGVAGIVFVVVLIIVAFASYEDPIDTLVEKYGKLYGLLK